MVVAQGRGRTSGTIGNRSVRCDFDHSSKSQHFALADADDANGRAVGLVQFDGLAIPQITAVERAVLEVYGKIFEGNDGEGEDDQLRSCPELDSRIVARWSLP